MHSSRKLFYTGNLSPALRAVAILLIPANLMASVPMSIFVAAISAAPPAPTVSTNTPLLPTTSSRGQLQPPTSAFAAQVPSDVPHPPAIPKFSPPVDIGSRLLALSSQSRGSLGEGGSSNPTDTDLVATHCFEVPLVPQAGNPQPNENSDLAHALLAFHNSPQDFTPLATYLDNHPNSRWNGSLLANLGLLYRNQGYFSKAQSAFEQAWSLTKDGTTPLQKAVADSALGLLADFYTRLGSVEQLGALINQAKGRDVQGSGTQPWAQACSSYQQMLHNPGAAFRCGPLAVGQISQLLQPGPDGTKARRKIHEFKATSPQGTSLADLQGLMSHVGLDYQVAFRSPGAAVPVPSIVHWKVGHYSVLSKQLPASFSSSQTSPFSEAILAKSQADTKQQEYFSLDRTFGTSNLISAAALDTEASGYFLIPAGSLPPGWRTVAADEAKTIFGKGDTQPPPDNPPPHKCPTCQQCGSPMTSYNFDQASVSLLLTDTPVGYAPPVGPSVRFTANYNQRELANNTLISNLGNDWSFDWLSYLEVSGSQATIFGPGGGQLDYCNISSPNSVVPIVLTQDILEQNTGQTGYTLYHKDGSEDVYGVTDGTNYYRTQSIDAQGNTVTYNYDSNYRLVTVTDAINQTTVLSYGNSTDPTNPAFYNITQVTDPFGRYATFTYNSSGQLTSITDILGITSSFTYGAGDFVTSLTTPYGTTQFAGSDQPFANGDSHRYLQVTDPLGGQERVEWVENTQDLPNNPVTSPGIIPTWFNDPYIVYRNTFYWSKQAMAQMPTNGPLDYTKARLTHWEHNSNDTSDSIGIPEITKEPLENRVVRTYPGQPGQIYSGSSNQPAEIARILDDGTEQDYKYQYNSSGNVTQKIDPLGRENDFVYDTNNIDLLQIKQKNGSGYDVLFTYTYNSQHKPLTVADASGQVTAYTYNSAGQLRTVTNAENETTTNWYSSTPSWTGQPTLNASAVGYLVEVDGPVAGATTRLNYDSFGRLSAVTDSEGYTITTSFDAFDRPIQVIFPDGTYTQALYNRLDPEWKRDRLGRWTHQLHDALQHLIVQEDPLGRKTIFDWCVCGALEGITDPAGNVTTWLRDAQSRVTQKIYPDGTNLSYTYEASTSRLKSVADAKGQVTNYQYYADNSRKQVSYTDTNGNPLNPATPTVSYTYDPAYLRIASMTDGTGTTNYTYNPVPASGTTTGANQVATVTGPLANSTIAYAYDQLGRVLSTSINGSANTSSVVYDALGRVTSASNTLGSFGLSYLDQTDRMSQVTYPNGQVTTYSYYPNSAATPGNDDERLQQIQNLGQGGANVSTFVYGYDAAGRIISWNKQFDANSILTSSFVDDAANQLIAASVAGAGCGTTTYSYQYDPAGNRTSEQIGSTVTASSYNNLNQLTSQGAGNNMLFYGTVSTVNNPVTLTVSGNTATMTAAGTDTSGNTIYNWQGTAPVTSGANSIPLVATDANGLQTSKTITVAVSGGTARTLTYDLDGNLVNNGAGQAYAYDAANRLTSVTQGSNVNGFVYDGLGHRVQETLNGALIKQWVWLPGEVRPSEERDPANNVTKRFYSFGEQIDGIAYFVTKDRLNSIREMTDPTGAIRARYDYDPYGRITKISGDLDADFGFTGFYRHQVSGLSLTLYRAYDPNMGRWLSRDPLPGAELSQGPDLYTYVDDNPIELVDAKGLSCESDFQDCTTAAELAWEACKKAAEDEANFLYCQCDRIDDPILRVSCKLAVDAQQGLQENICRSAWVGLVAGCTANYAICKKLNSK